jgi:iron complex transport system substrate-binding protein
MKSIRGKLIIIAFIFILAFAFCSGCTESSSSAVDANLGENTETITVTDALGRYVVVPKSPEHVICSGSGSLRLLSYLESQDKIVAVDSIETREAPYEARPYAYANPQFSTDYVVFGEFRGNDDPEKILALETQPQVIFKTYSGSGYDPVELQEKTGIPVVVLNYGDMVDNKDALYQSLRVMGEVMDKEERANKVINFFDTTITDLNERTSGIAEEDKISCYVGGIARSGPHGIQSTEPTYPPFLFTGAKNVAYDSMNLSTAEVAREKIIEWDPEIIFIDLSSIRSEDENNALYQLQNEDIYSELGAVKSGNVYGVLPYNYYTQNFGSILADSYYVGKLLYPGKFEDVDVDNKTIEIYSFLVCQGDDEKGAKVYERMKTAFVVPAFTKLDV